jgi:hypothetical protein
MCASITVRYSHFRAHSMCAAPIAGQVLENLGFRWCFRIFSIATFSLCEFHECLFSSRLTVSVVLLQIFFMPETVYSRKFVSPMQHAESRTKIEQYRVSKPVETTISPSSAEEGIQAGPVPMSYTQSLRVFSGNHNTDESPWLLIWRPVVLLVSPTVMVSREVLSACHNSKF